VSISPDPLSVEPSSLLGVLFCNGFDDQLLSGRVNLDEAGSPARAPVHVIELKSYIKSLASK
jgi:hypothetical protein